MADCRLSDRLTGGEGIQYALSPQKRALDLAFATGLVVPAGAGLLATKFALRGTGEAAIFRQTRIGRGGKIFVMHKLHTLDNATEDELFDAAGDFRSNRWDETLQAWDIFVGNMGMAGHRPVPTKDRQELNDNLIGYPDLQVGLKEMYEYERPGCLAPGALERYANGQTHHDLSPERIAQDIDYFYTATLASDLQLLGRFAAITAQRLTGSSGAVDNTPSNP